MAGNGNQNRGFKLRFDEMRESNPADSNDVRNEQASADTYGGPGHVRNIYFVQLDGKMTFLNYAYLVSCDFDPDNEGNGIVLGFTSHTITLKGYQLTELFFALGEQLPRLITAQDSRYRQTQEDGPMVTEIVVSEHNK